MGKSKGDGLVNYEVIIECLKESHGNSLTVRQIAQRIIDKYPAKAEKKLNKAKTKNKVGFDSINSPAFINQVSNEIHRDLNGIKEGNYNIITIVGTPKEYYYSEKSDDEEVDLVENESNKTAGVKKSDTFTEEDLYPILSRFLWSEFNIYSQHINASRSKKKQGKGGNYWLHPDVVGLEVLNADWHTEVKGCVKGFANKKANLWSFEVKKVIERSTIREYFFQAVSNSSWANFGYLVAAQINGNEAMKELRMLSALHGIGYIKLDRNVPEESQIIIPARERIDADWTNINRIVQENEEFENYIECLNEFYQIDKIKQSEWRGPDTDDI